MSRDVELLFEVATPELYLASPFRLTRLPIVAGEREIARRRREVEGAAKLGVAVASEAAPFPPLPDGHRVDVTEIVRQLNSLSDPGRRLVWELFWFWARDFGSSDPALAALEAGRPVVALEIWRFLAGRNDAVALHNLAVFHHLLALDYEAAAAGRRLRAEELQVCEAHWQLALEAWGRLLDCQTFWALAGELARRKADPRVDQEFLAAVRTRLADALALINGRLLARFAAEGSDADYNRHRRLLVRQFPPSAKEFALDETARPLLERLRADLSAKLRGGVVALDQVLAEIEGGPLRVIDTVLPPDSLLRQAAHAEVVERVLEAVGNLGQVRVAGGVDSDVVSRVLRRLQVLAEDPRTRDRVNRYLAVYR